MNKTFNYGSADALKNPNTKRQINRQMFAIIAPRYQWITQILSFGQDRHWKNELTAAIPDYDFPVCADLACGTGDISRLLANRFKKGKIIGIDLCPEMLELAKKYDYPDNLHYLIADIQTLPIENHSLDFITGGYALRNAPDLNGLLIEIDKKLKPGGWALFLDFSRPFDAVKANRQAKLLKFWTRLWGRIFHGNPAVYEYIADSLALFPNIVDLAQRIQQAGFINYSHQQYLAGFTALIKFQKPYE